MSPILLALTACWLATWSVTKDVPTLPSHEFRLPATESLSKLDNTRALQPDEERERKIETALAEDVQVPVVEPLTPLPTLAPPPVPAIEPPVLPVMAVEPPRVTETLPPSIPSVVEPELPTPRGDTPMTTWNWKRSYWPPVLTLVFAMPLPADEPIGTKKAEPANVDKQGAKTDSEKLDKIATDLNAIRETQSKLSTGLGKLDKIADEVKKLSESHVQNVAETQVAKADLKDLKDKVEQLQREIDVMRRTLPSVTKTESGYLTQQTGRILLVNSYSTPVTVLLNGASYRLEPNKVEVIERQPTGPFRYEVQNIQMPVERSLNANETFTIMVHNR